MHYDNLNRIGLSLKGPFCLQEAPTANDALLRPYMEVCVKRSYFNSSLRKFHEEIVSHTWKLDLMDGDLIDTIQATKKSFQFDITPIKDISFAANNIALKLHFISSSDVEVPLQLSVDFSPIYKKEGVIYAAIVLCGLYIMIIWEIVNRTFAAIIASTLSVGILAALNSRPSMVTIMSWIDVETLLLLFGMMILVAILSETGVFDYLAVYAYKVNDIYCNYRKLRQLYTRLGSVYYCTTRNAINAIATNPLHYFLS